MQLKFFKTILDGQDTLNRIAGLSWSPNNKKLAVATADNHILIFNELGERCDKFSTKPNNPDKGRNSYIIRGISFSSDSIKLAVAQSDCIIYVYKLGEGWKEKKTICNKFPQGSLVTSMIWLSTGPIIVGLDDGKIRLLNCKSNKSQSLYNGGSITVSLTSNYKGTGFLSGHQDGSIIRFFVVNQTIETSGRIIQHPVPPFAIAWSQTGILVAGCDKKIVIYDSKGQQIRNFDFTRSEDERDFTVASCSPNGQIIAVGSFNRIRLYSWDSRHNSWIEALNKEIEYFYSITSINWRKDGTKIAIGSSSGAVILFESVHKRTIWQDKYEFTFVAPSRVIIKSLHDQKNSTTIINSELNLEIDDVRLMGKDNYAVARTEETLILHDMIRNLSSEIPWMSSGRNERFYFENPNVCLIFNAGELTLVEYGENIILGSVRTEFVNPHVISVRLNERGNSNNNKVLAFLLDLKTISVLDLIKNTIISQISHDSKIDWIELNETGHKLLFRDKRMRLLLVDITTGKKQVLLNKVSFVQWVIQSDVAVAQTDKNLIIWYNIDFPEHMTLIPVNGEAFDVIRENGRTTVKTKEGTAEFSYELDEGLVEFGTAINDGDFARAVVFLESLGEKPAAKAMWHNLAIIALNQLNLRVAQRCYAALGNASKVFYLNEMIEIDDNFKDKFGENSICPEILARIALLDSDLKAAEEIYLNDGHLEAAISMYKNLKLYDQALILAEKRGYPGLKILKEEIISFLLISGQEDKAGRILERQGELTQAINLYLKSKKPSKAANLILKSPHLLQDEDLMLKITESLIKNENFELAGDIALKLSNQESALKFFRKGRSYARALELARKIAPDEVIQLEEEWGEYLVSKRQFDASINHFIEAGATEKALEAAVNAKQWRKAVQIAKVVDDPPEIAKYASELAKNLAVSGDFDSAEDILIRAEMFDKAIELLNTYGMWEKSYKIAEKYLNVEKVHDMFIELAKDLEKKGKYREAERVLVSVNEPDLAIAMYQRLEIYDHMIRLVEEYHNELVEDTHLSLAKQLESKGKWRNAEIHFLAAGDWKSAVHMYCGNGKWEDGYRVAKEKGVEGAKIQVAFMWAKSLSIESAARLLSKLSIIDDVIDLACDTNQYDFAIDLCQIIQKPIDVIYLKKAISLEDEGKFIEAEKEFIRANKPKEAILMYTHNNEWRSALRIAEQYLPEAVNDILINQAENEIKLNNKYEYENLLIQAQRPDMIIDYYKQNNMFEDAKRIAEVHLPSALNDIQRLSNSLYSFDMKDSKKIIRQASEYIKNEDFKKSIEYLLLIDETNAEQNTIERSLTRAAEICNQFLENKDAIEIANKLGPRLVKMKLIGQAVQVYLNAELPKEALNVFIETEEWNKARRLAKEIGPEYVSYVESYQKSKLKNEGNVEQLADIDIMEALDILAQQGQWMRCLEKAKQQNSQVLHKYLAMYSAQLIRDGDAPSALSLYLTYGTPVLQQNFNIYNRIALECFALREQVAGDLWKDLRTFLFQLTQLIKTSDHFETDFSERFDTLLLISHYYATRAACRQIQSLQNISTKISIALLRYTDLIPADKGFYEAGIDLRSQARESEAFVLLNHYLDICEAIEEGSGNLVDHSEFTATDFPSSVPIPEEIHLKNDIGSHEEIREWVLAVSMDQRVDQSLPMDERGLFESSLGPGDIPCIVCAYPINGRPSINFQRSDKQAMREAWSKLTVAAKMNPNSSVPDVIEFIEKLCGAANFLFH